MKIRHLNFSLSKIFKNILDHKLNFCVKFQFNLSNTTVNSLFGTPKRKSFWLQNFVRPDKQLFIVPLDSLISRIHESVYKNLNRRVNLTSAITYAITFQTLGSHNQQITSVIRSIVSKRFELGIGLQHRIESKHQLEIY